MVKKRETWRERGKESIKFYEANRQRRSSTLMHIFECVIIDGENASTNQYIIGQRKSQVAHSRV